VVTHEVFSALSCENDPTSVELRSFEDEIGLYEERVVKESWKLMKLSKSLSTGFQETRDLKKAESQNMDSSCIAQLAVIMRMDNSLRKL